MSDYYILIVYLLLFVVGLVEPFAFMLGYVWVDTFYPQLLSRLLNGFPVAMVMGTAAIIGYLLFDRRDRPKVTLTTILTIIMAIWVTLTSTWAVAPVEMVWNKWSWAVKTVAISAFIPYVIRSRIQIEAFLQVFAFSLLVHIVPVGIKTLITGGGYKTAMTVVRGNSGVLETSTLATTAILLVPVLLSLKRHSVLLPWVKWRGTIYNSYAALCGLAALGTYARTAIIGFAILGFSTLLQARRKVLYLIVLLLLGSAAGAIVSNQWLDRMETIGTYSTDPSAEGRIRVWAWTLEFIADHPFGGGFNSYYVNSFLFSNGAAAGAGENASKAFHSAYFEMLGEHGWLGLGIFVTLILACIWNLLWVVRQARFEKELGWCRDTATALLTAILVLIGCAGFIGIGFQVMFWYLFGISTSLRQHVSRTRMSTPQERGIIRAAPPVHVWSPVRKSGATSTF